MLDNYEGEYFFFNCLTQCHIQWAIFVFRSQFLLSRIPRFVMAKVLDNGFEMGSNFIRVISFTFGLITFEKPCYFLPAMGWILSLLFFYKDSLALNNPQRLILPFNNETKPFRYFILIGVLNETISYLEREHRKPVGCGYRIHRLYRFRIVRFGLVWFLCLMAYQPSKDISC